MGSIFSQTIGTDDTGSSGYSHRNLCQGVLSNGTALTVTFKAASTGTWTVAHASVGIQSSKYNTVSTPVELLFSGSSGFSLAASGTVTSDLTSLTFNKGDTLIVIVDVTTNNGKMNTTGGSGERYFLAATSSYNVASPGGSWGTSATAGDVSDISITGTVSAQTVFSTGLTNNDSGGENYSERVILTGLSTGAFLIQVIFKASAVAGWKTNNCSIGIQNTTYNTVSTPVELKFGGVSGFNIAADATIISDATSLTINSSDTLIVIFDNAATLGNPRNIGGSSTARYFKASTVSYNVASPTGSWSSDTNLTGILKVLTSPLVLTPDLFTNTNSFPTPTVVAGAISLTPGLFTNTNSFLAPLMKGVNTLTPDLLTNANSFSSPTVRRNIDTLTPTLFTNPNSFFAPLVSPGSRNLRPQVLVNNNIFLSSFISIPGPRVDQSRTIRDNWDCDEWGRFQPGACARPVRR